MVPTAALKFSMTDFIFQSFVLAAVSLRCFHVGEGNFSCQLLKRRETHRQVPHSNGCHQESKREGDGVSERRYIRGLIEFLSVNTTKPGTLLCCYRTTLTPSVWYSTFSLQSAPAAPARQPPCVSSPPSCAAASSGTAAQSGRWR